MNLIREFKFFLIRFFFFKQKTAYEMRISDWSSDVCSSDLGAIERAFEVSHHHVDPARAIGFGTRLASARLDYGMGMIEIDHRSKGPEAIAVDLSVGGQASHCPRLERVLGERRHRLEDGVTGVTGVIGGDRDDKWALVFGTAPRLAAGMFATQIEIGRAHV